jgi:hypothetical protein
LPRRLAATHHHVMGDCSGELTLHDWGVEYQSEEHGTWQWRWAQIDTIERKGPWSLSIETKEGELLGLVQNKRYNFTLTGTGLDDVFWKDYKEIAEAEATTRNESGDERVPAEEGEEPTEADLFYEATVAFENGELEKSQRKLEELLEANADFVGAAQLLEEVDVQLWKETLPLTFTAKHNHRIGSCTGKLSLTDWGIEYRSAEHGLWRWTFSEIRFMERPSRWRLELETEEMDLLVMGRAKRYKFELQNAPLEDQAWRRYQRLVRSERGE